MPGEDHNVHFFDEGFRIADWRVRPSQNRIVRDGTVEQLEPKVMQVLVCLAHHARRTVTKEQFMEEVWTDTIVTNDVLARCISELRKVLGDDARNPSYIETIRKTGYRLIAPVRPENSAPHLREETQGASSALAEGSPAKTSSIKTPSIETPSTKALPAKEGDRPAAPPEQAKQPAQAKHEEHQPHARRRPVPLWTLALVVVLCVAGGATLLQRAFPTEPPAPPETVPFTSFPGEEFESALSPDGERVAFVWNGGEGDNFDIYVKQPGASTPLRITATEDTDERSPTWSPAGDRLAFVRAAEDGSSIVIVPAIGGSERTVARFEARNIRGLVWSPDGETLALSAQPAAYEAYSIYLLSVNTLEKRRLTAPPGYYRGDFYPSFSPDGETIAFARSLFERIEDVYTVPVEGGVPKRLTYDRSEISGLDWAGDRSIIYASNRTGTSQIWRISATGSPAELVTASSGGDGLHQPSISRQGRRMTLTRRSIDVNIWTLRRLSQVGRFTSHVQILSTRWDSNPDIAPDSEHVAFSSKRSGHFEIWTSQRDGTEPMQLTHFEGPFTSTPVWSPNGERIAFVSRQEENADIYLIDASGGTPRRITRMASGDVAPSWSHDGQWIYFASNRSGRWQVWKVPASGGPAQQVTFNGGFAAFEGPKGEALYFVRQDAPGIWKLPLRKRGKNEGKENEGKKTAEGAKAVEATLVVEGLEPYDWGNWAVTEGGIYFIRRRGGRPVLAYHSFTGGRAYNIAYLQGEVPRHPSLAVAPNGDWFLYAKVDRSESDIMLVENFR